MYSGLVFEADCTLLEATGCDFVFAPGEADLFPEPQTVFPALSRASTVKKAKQVLNGLDGVERQLSSASIFQSVTGKVS